MRNSRSKARELVLQGLYQWLLNPDSWPALEQEFAERKAFRWVEAAYFSELLRGSVAHAPALRAAFTPLLDRSVESLRPVEHAILLLAAYELQFRPEIPYRVVINEAVELAKSYGGTDGHKYITGVLDKLAAVLRPHETRPSGTSVHKKIQA